MVRKWIAGGPAIPGEWEGMPGTRKKGTNRELGYACGAPRQSWHLDRKAPRAPPVEGTGAIRKNVTASRRKPLGCQRVLTYIVACVSLQCGAADVPCSATLRCASLCRAVLRCAVQRSAGLRCAALRYATLCDARPCHAELPCAGMMAARADARSCVMLACMHGPLVRSRCIQIFECF